MQQILALCKSFSNTCTVLSRVLAHLVLKHKMAYEGDSWPLCTLTFWQKVDFFFIGIAIFLIKVSEVNKGYSETLRKSMITFRLRQFEQTATNIEAIWKDCYKWNGSEEKGNAVAPPIRDCDYYLGANKSANLSLGGHFWQIDKDIWDGGVCV